MPGQHIQLFGSFGSSLTAEEVSARLSLLDPQQPLVVEVNSDGGSVQEGVAVFNLLRQWPGGVDVEIVGWALSVASLVAMAGRRIAMHPTSLLMVHAPWVGTTGNASELRTQAALLDLVASTMRSAYGRTRQKTAVVDQWLSGPDHWFTADEALRLGLVDEIVQTPASASYANASASRFPIPHSVLERIRTMPAPQASADPAAIRAEVLRAESKRRADIRAALGPMVSKWPDMQACVDQCTDDPDCSVELAKQRVLAELGRGVTPAVSMGYVGVGFELGSGGQSDFGEAARDALLMRAGIRLQNPHPEAAQLRHMSVVTMAETMLSRAGRAPDSRAPDRIIKAALSTSDFPNLLADVAYKALRTGYAETPTTFTVWTGEKEVADFKPATLALMSEAPDLLEVPEYGEYRHGILSDSASSFQLATFGRVLRISRQALVNDNLGAFADVPKALGQAARRLEADKVYGLLSGNPTMKDGVPLFHANHGNQAPAGSAPSVEALDAARQAMRKQRGIAGLSFVDPVPRYIICPVELELTFESILADLLSPTKGEKFGPAWMRELTVVADPRLSEADPSAWYLSADPAQIDGLVRAYLAGEQRPYLDEFTETKLVDATSYKARLDFAVGVVDYRALYKNPGSS